MRRGVEMFHDANKAHVVSPCVYFVLGRMRKRAKIIFSAQKYEQTVKAAAASRWACPPASSLPVRGRQHQQASQHFH